MEFYNLGRHCSLCKAQDYLPFKCEHCNNWFCSNHRLIEDHKCSKYVSNSRYSDKVNHVKFARNCEYKKCREDQITQCKFCKKSFCLNHRFEQDHKCKAVDAYKERIGRPFAINMVDRKLREAIRAQQELVKLKKELGFETSYDKKVRLEKRKRGQPLQFSNTPKNPIKLPNLEKEDEFLLRVFFPLDSDLQPVFWIFKKNKKIGNIIDLIAKKGNILNENNTNKKEKLNLYHLQTGLNFPTTSTLEELMQDGILEQGDSIILERGLVGEGMKEQVIRKLSELIMSDSLFGKRKSLLIPSKSEIRKTILLYS